MKSKKAFTLLVIVVLIAIALGMLGVCWCNCGGDKEGGGIIGAITGQ